ncbi:MAG: hypothetical protein E6J90_19545 [Deltaproteobacteria bacterium]|nr:MAG: hypothetical protein E6J90_19545 [Deltaproteobacteria bacterium]
MEVAQQRPSRARPQTSAMPSPSRSGSSTVSSTGHRPSGREVIADVKLLLEQTDDTLRFAEDIRTAERPLAHN